MRVTFLTQDYALCREISGGGSTIVSHLEAILNGGHDVDLVMLRNRDSPRGFDSYLENFSEYWNALSSKLNSIRFINTERSESGLLGGYSIKKRLFSKWGFEFKDARTELQHLKSQVENDRVFWCEHLPLAALANIELKLPNIIFSHHDWFWKLAQLKKNRSLFNRFYLKRLRIFEESIVRKSDGYVTGSDSELREVKSMFGKKPTAYLPPYYDIQECSLDGINEFPAVIHLGQFGATANKIGVQNFTKFVWPTLKRSFPKLRFFAIGGKSELLSEGCREFLGSNDGNLLGFVKDLRGTMRPYDVHVIPWDQNTGFRTKLPVIFGYSQALVAMSAAVKSNPEARHMENCLLVDSYDEMVNAIEALTNDVQLRKRLGDNARNTFTKEFSKSEMVNRTNLLLEQVTGQSLK